MLPAVHPTAVVAVEGHAAEPPEPGGRPPPEPAAAEDEAEADASVPAKRTSSSWKLLGALGGRSGGSLPSLITSSSPECWICVEEAAIVAAAESGGASSSTPARRSFWRRPTQCPFCGRHCCSSHGETITFPLGVLPDCVGPQHICKLCAPQARELIEEEVEAARRRRRSLAEVQRMQLASRLARRAPVQPEVNRQCIECDEASSVHCLYCGLALCSKHQVLQPTTGGEQAPGRLKVCAACVDVAAAKAWAHSAVRAAVAGVFRCSLAAWRLDVALAGLVPPLEDEEDCAGCGMVFRDGRPGWLRHHCRACRRSLCSACLCGKRGCLGQGTFCPHQHILPQYGHDNKVRICHKCLPFVKVRVVALDARKAVTTAAMKYAEHWVRTVTFLDDPGQLPFYEQGYVDTAAHKAFRLGTLAVQGAKSMVPFLSMPWAIGVRAVDIAWNYGQYGIVGILCRSEIIEGLQGILAFSKELQGIQPRELIVGMVYLSAEQRKSRRDDPEGDKRDAVARGRPVPRHLLDAITGLAVLGVRAPYEETAFDAQRFALQQEWRVVTERLSESWKHRPAWCLYMRHEQKVAVVAVRGTAVDKSAGGDLFTDFNLQPEHLVGADGKPVLAHSGMLAAARVLERELRPTLRAIATSGYRVIFTGHSLGAAVAALLLWLVRFGPGGEQLPAGADVMGVGYATPCAVDRRTAMVLRSHFTSVVNAVDVVPRLSVGSMSTLSQEITACARESGAHLDQDVKEFADRVANVWAPRLREGAPLRELAREVSEEHPDVSQHEPSGGAASAGEEPAPSEDERANLFVPGSIVWIHRVSGHLEARVVPCDLPQLRRIVLDARMLTDHYGSSYHEALRAVQAWQSLEEAAAAANRRPHYVRWQSFSRAGELCPCCGSIYEWMSTARSEKSRAHTMTNCRACGRVVCLGCATIRRVLPEQAILYPARICDRCVWGGEGSGEELHTALRGTPAVLQSFGS